MRTLFIALRVAIFGTGFIFLWRWVALSLHHRYDISLGIGLSDWTRTLGIVLMVVGGTLAFACVAIFVTRGEGTPAPFDPPRNFVAVGPYKYVRNPMYIGGFAVLFGFGLYEQTVPSPNLYPQLPVAVIKTSLVFLPRIAVTQEKISHLRLGAEHMLTLRWVNPVVPDYNPQADFKDRARAGTYESLACTEYGNKEVFRLRASTGAKESHTVARSCA